ncbi:hypothetical protein [uncultured Photobacterium sp.]|uniref:hypothetical protein n=1 Tax=uncultured Photobacterium sp. TaxID=173973 RepID=UPI002629C476|nr:hypothetical protein [uncultured Photobacterium sp.]
MIKKPYLIKLLNNKNFLLLIAIYSSNCFSFMLDGELTGNDLKFRNVVSSVSSASYKTLADWEPEHNLLPTTAWSPGFKHDSKNIVLVGPSGAKVDISDAVSIVGLEYKSSNALEEVSEKLSVTKCDTYGTSGNIAYVVNSSGSTVCSGSVVNGYNAMPYHFIRPILSIDNAKIVEAFNNLPIEEKQEGFYNYSFGFTYPYGFIVPASGVKTWQNLFKNFVISIAYKPGYIADVRLENPGVHEFDFSMTKPESPYLEGIAKFNVIATGSFPTGLVLNIPTGNDFSLKHINGKLGAADIPIDVICPNCEVQELVTDGVEQVSTTKINVSGTKVKFPIDVKIKKERETVALGQYYGNFVFTFGLNL